MVLSETAKKAIEAILDKGDRVELIPIKNDVKVMRIKREEIKETRLG